MSREHPCSYRSSPCRKCPWRLDVDLTEFSDADMDMLVRASGRAGADAGLGAGSLACHLDQPGTRHALRWCAGWAAGVGAVTARPQPPCRRSVPMPNLRQQLENRRSDRSNPPLHSYFAHRRLGTPDAPQPRNSGPARPLGCRPPPHGAPLVLLA
ncbi:DUF6283 family protein [Streptomyces sp. OUCMDZ-4982]|uniref:DUF6283 family protein n=1 Tax=Streptomyces sp. OUCMDZ-4982 TaxID=2973090 RepID=UPI0037DD7E4A